MSHAVTVSIDSAGRLLLPRTVREEAGLVPGVPFEVTVTEGRIEMRSTVPAVHLVRKGRLTVAVADDDLPPLTEQEVLALREELRHSRSED